MEEHSRSNDPLILTILKDWILPFLLPAKVPNIGIVLFSTFGLSYLVQQAWINLAPERLFYEKTSLIGYSMITLFRLLILLLIYVLITEHYKIKEHHTWGRNPGLGVFFMSFLAGVPAMMLSVSVHNLFIYLELRMENPIPSQLFYYVTTEESIWSILLLLVIGLLLPVLIEELFFRGLVYSVLPDKWWIRIPLPAIISTLFAMNRLEFLSFLIIALIASTVRYCTDSTLCSILTRISLFCINVFLSRVLPTQDPSMVQNALDYSRTTLYASIIGLVLGLVMIIVLLRQFIYVRYRLKNEDASCNSEEGKPLTIPLRDQFHIDFFLGVALLFLCWVTL